jgi:ribonuclease HI
METKKSLTYKLNALKKALNNEELETAFKAIAAEIKSFEPPKKDLSTDGFELPKEIKGQNEMALFSDGACRGNPGPGSWAFIAQDAKGKVVNQGSDFEEQTTNNRMELKGAIYALKFAKQENKEKLYLYTDSKYVVDGVEKWVAGWKSRGWKKADKKEPENLDLWKEIDSLVQNLNVKLMWVKGHAGHPQNEYCDQLANQTLDEAGF